MKSNQTLLESLGAVEGEDYEKEVSSVSSPSSTNSSTLNKLKDFELETVSSTSNIKDVEVVEVGASTEQISDLARIDLDFLAALIMPTICAFLFPPVFKSVWSWLLAYVNKPRTFPRLALGLPRGFGKTTLVKIFILYCILFTNKKFILIISATATLAENILADVTDMLNEPNIKRVFGDWNLGMEKNTQSVKKFGYRGRNIILAAIGAEGSLRGLNIKNVRPDVMIFEDIQTRECADSETQSINLKNWMVGTAMKAKSPTGCMFLFIANMYPTKFSILRSLKTNPTWIKFITGGIQADGTSLWEELQPLEQLLEEFESDLAMGSPEIFYAEVLNDENASMNNLIDLSKLPKNPYSEGDISAGNFIIIDPANDKVNSDAVSIGYFEVHNGYPVLMKLEEGRLSPGDTIRAALTFALTYNCRLIVCESNAYQYSLLYWFKFICDQLELVGIECVPIYSGARAKNVRIIEMFKGYAKGELFVHEDCKLAVHSQITSFAPMKRDNTDGILDLLTYAPRVIEEFGEFVVASNIIESQTFDSIEVLGFNSPF